MEFLGVLTDSVRRVVSLVPEKMALYDQHADLTLGADAKGSLAVDALQSQLGKLSWFSEVLVESRARPSRIRAGIPGGGSYRPYPHMRISLQKLLLQCRLGDCCLLHRLRLLVLMSCCSKGHLRHTPS